MRSLASDHDCSILGVDVLCIVSMLAVQIYAQQKSITLHINTGCTSLFIAVGTALDAFFVFPAFPAKEYMILAVHMCFSPSSSCCFVFVSG